jgi:hypothetical protein
MHAFARCLCPVLVGVLACARAAEASSLGLLQFQAPVGGPLDADPTVQNPTGPVADDAVPRGRTIFVVGYGEMHDQERRVVDCLMKKLKMRGEFSFPSDSKQANWSLSLWVDIPSFWTRTQQKQAPEVSGNLMAADGSQVLHVSNQYVKATSIWGPNIECGLANGLAKKIVDALDKAPTAPMALGGESGAVAPAASPEPAPHAAQPPGTQRQTVAFDRNQRIEIPGVSVLPPQGEGWFLFPNAAWTERDVDGAIHSTGTWSGAARRSAARRGLCLRAAFCGGGTYDARGIRSLLC